MIMMGMKEPMFKESDMSTLRVKMLTHLLVANEEDPQSKSMQCCNEFIKSLG